MAMILPTERSSFSASVLLTCDCLPHILRSLGRGQKRQGCLLHGCLAEAALQSHDPSAAEHDAHMLRQ